MNPAAVRAERGQRRVLYEMRLPAVEGREGGPDGVQDEEARRVAFRRLGFMRRIRRLALCRCPSLPRDHDVGMSPPAWHSCKTACSFSVSHGQEGGRQGARSVYCDVKHLTAV